ncbi:MAG: hypothetical protein AAF810_01270 [Cyanobacteria bacterium P01_D01_bin.36]
MNQNFNQLQGRFPQLGCWLFLLIAFWVVGAIGITGILKSIFALVLFLVLAPVVGFWALQFWVKRNLVEGSCPVCTQPLTGIKKMKTPCPSCGTEVMATSEGFERVAADGVIDVQVVNAQASTVDISEDVSDSATTIDVEVQRLPEAEA